jgi:hypothetical protein
VNTSVRTVENNGKLVELGLTSDKNARVVPNKVLHIIWRNSIDTFVLTSCRFSWQWKFIQDGLQCKQCRSASLCKALDQDKEEDREHIFAHRLAALGDTDANLIDANKQHRSHLCDENVNDWVDPGREREFSFWSNRVDQFPIFGYIHPLARKSQATRNHTE